jgi:hypothetical protein
VLDAGTGSERIVATSASAPFAAYWSVDASAGDHTLLARAYRAAGHTDSASVSFTAFTFAGDFSALVTSTPVIQYYRPDVNSALGGTLLFTGTSPAITITGSAAAPVGVLVKVTTGGTLTNAKIDVSYDGGVTWAMSGVTSAATVALTGAGSGITLNMAAGTYVLNNTYLGTLQTIHDFGTGAHDMTQATAAQQPTLDGLGVNGRPFARLTGGTVRMSAAQSMPAPATTPNFIWATWRFDTWHATGANDVIWCANGANAHVVLTTAAQVSPALSYSSGTLQGPTFGSGIGCWVHGHEQYSSNSVNDYLLMAGTQIGGASTGNNVSASPMWLGSPTAGRSAAYSLATRLITQVKPTATELAQLRAASRFYFEALSVTFLGDSITVGYDDVHFDPTTLDGFRPGTATNIRAKGLSRVFEFVGNNIGGSVPTNHYQASSGAKIETQDSNIVNFFGTGKLVHGVSIFRTLLGTNNVTSDPANTTSHYQTLFDDIYTASPGCAVSVGRVPPVASTKQNAAALNATIVQMNGDIAAEVTRQTTLGRAVIFEADAGLVDADFASGGVHLIASGNVKMAVVAANGIEAAARLAGFIP